MNETTSRIVAAIRAIPAGSIASYGAIAAAAGLPNGARMVARVLHSSSRSQDLPWWRVVRADGTIALPRGGGYEEQAALLAQEGVLLGPSGKLMPAPR
jgi:methylated-DNA-protein-cysteine methyltransferase related protein